MIKLAYKRTAMEHEKIDNSLHRILHARSYYEISLIPHTPREKNEIESKRFAANEIIYLIQWYFSFEWPGCLWNLVRLIN